jgi:hypothetical protein
VTDLFSEFPVVADAATWGPAGFSHIFAVLVIAGVACLKKCSCLGLL